MATSRVRVGRLVASPFGGDAWITSEPRRVCRLRSSAALKSPRPLSVPGVPGVDKAVRDDSRAAPPRRGLASRPCPAPFAWACCRTRKNLPDSVSGVFDCARDSADSNSANVIPSVCSTRARLSTSICDGHV